MTSQRKSFRRRLVKLILYANLGILMFASKILMEWAPNIHLMGVLTVIYTLVFRAEALIPIYVCVFINGLFIGGVWWFPYLYIWAVLWAAVMLLPKKMPEKLAPLVYMTVCGLHGLFFGVLYAPAQAFLFNLSFEKTLVWIAAGFWFDIVHAIGNFCLGVTIYPISRFLLRLKKKYIDSI